MEWDILQGSRWDILSELSKGKKSMEELAESAGTSMANASQQLRLLEAHGLVSRTKAKKDGSPGKPKSLYMLSKGLLCLGLVSKGTAFRRVTETKDDFLTNLFVVPSDDDRYHIAKLILTHEDLISKCDALCYLRSSHGKVELLVVTDKVEEVRKEYSSISVESQGKKKEFACWTHSLEEITAGVKADDHYYTELLKNFKVIYDPNRIMQRWMD